jgi:hypothetical protein
MARRAPKISQSLERRVFGFFVAKGLLIAPHIAPKSSVKLRIADVVNVGLHVEPRIIEVLPAAMLHFPRSFIGYEDMPEKLREALDCIRSGKELGPSLAGIPYKAMLRWANEPLPDKRTRPERDRRITKAFRLKRAALEKLKTDASSAGLTETRYLEELLLGREFQGEN